MAAATSLLSLLLLLAVGPSQQQSEFAKHLERILRKKLENGPLSYGGTKEAHWPRRELDIGAIGGVAVDATGQPQIFHRASHVWSVGTFNSSHHYTAAGAGPIQQPTLLTLDSVTGAVVKREGAGRYYLPHGLHIDRWGNRWLTDVALHQVFKLPADRDTPVLTLGRPLEPGSDRAHFCKPTDVAVAEDGTVFVADGYCNSRVVVLDDKGGYLTSLGQRDGVPLLVPHSLALTGGVLFVADRENSRVVAWGVVLQAPGLQVINLDNYGKIYAVDSDGTVLYALYHGRESGILTISLNSGTVLEDWTAAKGLVEGHDLSVSPDGQTVYVGQLQPPLVTKFLTKPDFYERQ